jgi:hypothetical protein
MHTTRMHQRIEELPVLRLRSQHKEFDSFPRRGAKQLALVGAGLTADSVQIVPGQALPLAIKWAT